MRRFFCLLIILISAGCSQDPETTHLFTRMDDTGLPRTGKTFGCTWADVDGDGRLDMFLSRHGHGAEIYLNRGDLTFELLVNDIGLPEGPRDNHGASAVDFDCDGDWDIYVSAGSDMGRDAAINELMVQEAPGIFLGGLEPGHLLADKRSSGRGGLWLELDGDRYPELLLTHYLSPVRLFHQDGVRWFDWSDRVCLDRPQAKSPVCSVFQAASADLDLDGRADLFIAGYEWGLLHNPGEGRLQDVTEAAGLPLRSLVLAEAIFADIDGDGDPDLLTAWGAPPALKWWWNESDSTGLHFRPEADFLDLPLGEQIDSVLLADLDNDGLLDIYIAQYAERHNQLNLAAQGLGDGRFQPKTEEWGLDFLAEALPAGAWALDLDHDGDLDLVQVRGRGGHAEFTGTVDVFRNETLRRGFTLRLESRTGPPHGLGARVEMELNGRRMVRQVNSRGSYYNTTVPPLHFGVDEMEGPFTLQVDWPDGCRQEIRIPAAGAAYVLREGEEEVRVVD